MGLPQNVCKNIWHQYYEAGPMMYLHDEDLAKLKKNLANFMDTPSKPQGRYSPVTSLQGS